MLNHFNYLGSLVTSQEVYAEVEGRLEKLNVKNGEWVTKDTVLAQLSNKEKQKELCALIIKRGLSVREAEAIAKRWSEKPKKAVAPVKKKGDLESQLSSLQDSMRKYLGTKVHILQKGKRGKIEIEYYSHEDLERIVEAILGKNA